MPATGELVFRVPQNPAECVAKRTELVDKLNKARARAVRANAQAEKMENRISRIDARLAEFQASGGGDIKKAAQDLVAMCLAEIEALKAQFGL